MMPTTDLPALYLECRYDRAMALRVIIRRLTQQLYHQGVIPGAERTRLLARLERARTHLAAITGVRS
ncbi:hypothetical protein [Nocardiopsis sp. FR26]|uniref:hypothetical protein n=1 Tax=Nocardiopsis sp. FR26 TaxID=2605987 RepID=UPI00135CD40F|nr:hypothetical protein [Nocardiopsis sp. FR26]